ncbi:Trihelix transcription factor ASIL2 [Sesamum alatum]|uniref:Trihelix transcription factor ASIL2 n=1 Tax=Sesamum alatum TaxID=300844 RepID=A0AAE2CJU7_9LAMI|nr:Trihelix transcription factor ASIL2 [Sesamum alatum]
MRLKRDEWSEGAVSSLLEAYEAKWSLRNRAKLKGQDWEDVAKCVSAREHNSKSPKTQTQCKNKIESMKKRYRSESAAGGAGDASSSWPLYPRLDLLLRGNAGLPPPATVAPLMQVQVVNPPPAVVMETLSSPPQPRRPLVLPPGSAAVKSHESGDVDRLAKKDGNNSGPKLSEQESHKNHIDHTDSSTAAVHGDKEKSKGEKTVDNATKRRRDQGHAGEIGESIRWLAEVVVRSEQARMETMREIERIRVEAEAKRGEMDLKRTEIIANTQLEIAKLFARGSVDSSLRMGRS